jgi:hypothetical protein
MTTRASTLRDIHFLPLHLGGPVRRRTAAEVLAAAAALGVLLGIGLFKLSPHPSDEIGTPAPAVARGPAPAPAVTPRVAKEQAPAAVIEKEGEPFAGPAATAR